MKNLIYIIVITIFTQLPALAVAGGWDDIAAETQAGAQASKEVSTQATVEMFDTIRKGSQSGDSQLISGALDLFDDTLVAFRSRCAPTTDAITVGLSKLTNVQLRTNAQKFAREKFQPLLDFWVQHGNFSPDVDMSTYMGGEWENELSFLWSMIYILGNYGETITDQSQIDFVHNMQSSNKNALKQHISGMIQEGQRAASNTFPGSSLSCQTGSGRLVIDQGITEFNSWDLISYEQNLSPFSLAWSKAAGNIYLTMRMGSGVHMYDMSVKFTRGDSTNGAPVSAITASDVTRNMGMQSGGGVSAASSPYRAHILKTSVGVTKSATSQMASDDLKKSNSTGDETILADHMNQYYSLVWMDRGPLKGQCRQVSDDKCNILGFFAQLTNDRAFASDVIGFDFSPKEKKKAPNI